MRPISPKTLYRLSASLPSDPPFLLQISHLSTSSPSHHSHAHSSFRRHDEEVRNVRVSVWWDFENCNLPAGVNVFKVANAITAAIRANGIKGPIQITAFGDMLQLSRFNQEALSSTGVNLTHVPHGGKNSADRSLLVDLMYWVSQNPPPAHLFLISGDRDFASILHRLRMNNYNILLASPENSPGVLCSAASIMWPWHALLTGETLTGKYFNQPPDGPYGSWYGHYKVPLEDPYSVIEQPSLSQTEKLSEPGSDSKPRPIPFAVRKQIHKILKSHPNGISITELRMELAQCNLHIDRDFYGYKKFSRFLLAIPHILKLKSLGDGKFLVHGSPKSSEPCEYNIGTSTEPVSDIGDRDLNSASQLDCEDRSINVSANRKLSGFTSHEPNAEKPCEESEHPSNNSLRDSGVKSQLPLSPENVKSLTKPQQFSPHAEKSISPPSSENIKPSTKPQQISPLDEKSLSPPSSKNVKTSAPIDEEVVEVATDQDTELHFSLEVAQDSSYEVGYFKRIWRNWFGGRVNVSGTTSHNGLEEFCTSGDDTKKEDQDSLVKQHTSVDNAVKGNDEKKHAASSEVVDQALPASFSSSHDESAKDNKTATTYPVSGSKSKTNPGIFGLIVNWCKFGRSSPCSDKLSDQSRDRLNLMDNRSQVNKLFSTDSFWAEMESFMDTPKGSVAVFKSRTREQMALNLQKEGPLSLRSLCKDDLLRLVDLLMSEKKWVEECPSQMSPFKLTDHGGKSSLDQSNGSNRLRSIFLDQPSQHDMQRSREHDGEEKCRNIPHSGVSLPTIRKTPPDRSRSEILADCRKLVNELLKEHPAGYNMGLFRKVFFDRYGYHLDLHMLGYQKLATLLQALPGVKVESSHILPSFTYSDQKPQKMFDMKTSGPSIQKHTASRTAVDSDGNLTDASCKDDGSDSPWEELGPVANGSNKNEVQLESRRKAIVSTGFDYEPSLSDDFSDSEEETSPITESEGQRAARVNREDSSLLQILDSWYSNKDGESSKHKSENVDRTADSTNVSKLSGFGITSGTSLADHAWKQRPQKSYSFVTDSCGDNKDKLIDGILGSLKKPSEPRMES
ncbi:unnamed protein product [Malus baccata var. baccata]